MKLSPITTTLSDGTTIYYRFEGTERCFGRLIPCSSKKIDFDLKWLNEQVSNCLELDMKLAFFVLLSQYCKEYSIECPKLTNAISTDIIERGFNQSGLSKKTVKQSIYRYLFGLDSEFNWPDHKKSDIPSKDRIRKTEYIKEINKLKEEIWKITNELYKTPELMEYKEAANKEWLSSLRSKSMYLFEEKFCPFLNKQYLFLRIILTHRENQIMTHIMNYLQSKDIKVSLFMCDGLHIDKEYASKESLYKLIPEILETIDIPIQLRVKKSNINYYNDCEQTRGMDKLKREWKQAEKKDTETRTVYEVKKIVTKDKYNLPSSSYTISYYAWKDDIPIGISIHDLTKRTLVRVGKQWYIKSTESPWHDCDLIHFNINCVMDTFIDHGVKKLEHDFNL